MNTNRIINLRIKVWKYLFDAAIDCNYALHAYDYFPNEQIENVPIELYNCNGDQDVKVIFNSKKELQKIDPNWTADKINELNSYICHTFVSENFIRNEIKKWIAENNKWYAIYYKLCCLFHKRN